MRGERQRSRETAKHTKGRENGNRDGTRGEDEKEKKIRVRRDERQVMNSCSTSSGVLIYFFGRHVDLVPDSKKHGGFTVIGY